jgi:hypothetical protein
MKIVKEVGEQPSPRLHRRIAAEVRPILAVRGAGSALTAGSRVLLRRGWDLLGEYVDGWQRYAALAAGGYVAVYAVGQAPHIPPFAVPGAVVAWCVAAWWAAPPADCPEPAKAVEADAPVTDPQDVRAATLEWIRQRIGDRQGVHLRDLLEHAQAHGMFEGLDVTELRGHLERWGIPVRDRVRVRGLGVTVGVYRPDLPAPSEPLPDPDGQDPPDSELHPA